ncbi:MAG: four helix bundle protein [Chlorobia bacterium]|nr:four helix bundle protein [Fimbriimonadaceae bacterium]
MELVAESYRLTSSFPREEMFGLTRQLRNAAVSVNLNIAEGWGRNGKAEFARFADIARASANEVEAAVEIAVRLEYLRQDQLDRFYKLLDRVCSMLYRLIESLRKPKP